MRCRFLERVNCLLSCEMFVVRVVTPTSAANNSDTLDAAAALNNNNNINNPNKTTPTATPTSLATQTIPIPATVGGGTAMIPFGSAVSSVLGSGCGVVGGASTGDSTNGPSDLTMPPNSAVGVNATAAATSLTTAFSSGIAGGIVGGGNSGGVAVSTVASTAGGGASATTSTTSSQNTSVSSGGGGIRIASNLHKLPTDVADTPASIGGAAATSQVSTTASLAAGLKQIPQFDDPVEQSLASLEQPSLLALPPTSKSAADNFLLAGINAAHLMQQQSTQQQQQVFDSGQQTSSNHPHGGVNSHVEFMNELLSKGAAAADNVAGMNGNHFPLMQFGLMEGLNSMMHQQLQQAVQHQHAHNNGYNMSDVAASNALDSLGLGLGLSHGGGAGGSSMFDQLPGRNDNHLLAMMMGSGAGGLPGNLSLGPTTGGPPSGVTVKKDPISNSGGVHVHMDQTQQTGNKLLITPKPIESMMPSPPDKRPTQQQSSQQQMAGVGVPPPQQSPSDLKIPSAGVVSGGVGGGNQANFAQAFKTHEQNVKNASSWSILASAGSPQNTPTSNKTKPAMDSFQQFRNKAKEKADRQKQLEAAEKEKEQKRQKEAAEKEQQRKQHHTKSSHLVVGGSSNSSSSGGNGNGSTTANSLASALSASHHQSVAAVSAGVQPPHAHGGSGSTAHLPASIMDVMESGRWVLATNKF